MTAVGGSAFGYHAFDLILGSDPQPEVGPTPVVELASDASNSPQTATQPEGAVYAGPATLFTSGEITVRTAGSLGPNGSVTSSTDIANVNRGGSEVFSADRVQSTCTATEAGVTGGTTITNGRIRTHAQAQDHDEGVVSIPVNPPAGYVVEGHLHLGNTQENFRYVFNEQVPGADGRLTVNAVHAYFLGPFARGELIVGQSVCGPLTLTERPQTDLAVSITDDPDPVAGGGRVTYTVVVDNLSDVDATQVRLVNTASSGSKIVSAVPEQGTCTVKGRRPGCDLGAIAGGDAVMVTVVAQAPRLKRGAATTMSLTSTVSSAETDSNPANNTATESTAVQ
ncbi:MAG TPA: DUF11 domain-containing protein [Egibacteraceae bacterium]|nr:DUF11 domain-containing protein [Egibacteraceae bacterium]